MAHFSLRLCLSRSFKNVFLQLSEQSSAAPSRGSGPGPAPLALELERRAGLS